MNVPQITIVSTILSPNNKRLRLDHPRKLLHLFAAQTSSRRGMRAKDLMAGARVRMNFLIAGTAGGANG